MSARSAMINLLARHEDATREDARKQADRLGGYGAVGWAEARKVRNAERRALSQAVRDMVDTLELYATEYAGGSVSLNAIAALKRLEEM